MNNPYWPPKSQIEVDSSSRPSGFWRFFFWLHVICIPLAAIGVAMAPGLNTFDCIDLAVFLIAALGLFGYGYGKRLASQGLWKVVAILYPLWLLLYEITLPLLGVPSYGELSQLDASLLLTAIFVLPTALAFYLYAFRSPTLWDAPALELPSATP